MMGANDMTLNTWETYKGNLLTFFPEVRKAMPWAEVVWCPTLPYGQGHASYAAFLAKQQTMVSEARDPAQWGRWCDYMIPVGAHPLFVASSPKLWDPSNDYVHTNWRGHFLLNESFSAGMESLLDVSTRGSRKLYNKAWLADNLDIPDLNTVIEDFMYLSGLDPKGVWGTISVSGAGADFRIGQGAFLTTYTGWIYNGDQLGVRLTTPSAANTEVSFDLTVLGETRTIRRKTSVASPYTARFDEASASLNAWIRDYRRSMSGGIFSSLNPQRVRGDVALTNATGYVEFTVKHGAININRNPRVGLVNSAASITGDAVGLGTTAGTFAMANGNYWAGTGTVVQFSATLNGAGAWNVDGAVVGMLVHKATGKVWLRTSGGWYPDAPTFAADGSLLTGTGVASGLTDFYFAAGSSDQTQLTVNAGQKAFVHDAAIPTNVVKGWA
jgi:hypothetical protein